jgi:RAC serine/threonine-protein kinase
LTHTDAGEYIKNWRPRFFRLYSDGTFLGFKNGPVRAVMLNGEDNGVLTRSAQPCNENPLNYFSVSKAKVSAADKIKPNAFVGASRQVGGDVARTFAYCCAVLFEDEKEDRVFHVQTPEDRDEWMRQLIAVAASSTRPTDKVSECVDVPTVASLSAAVCRRGAPTKARIG